MKNLFTILLPFLIIPLFLSCSMEPEQDFVENEKETFESLKMKVEAMAQEYGVGVSINDKVWRKRLPTIDDIEKDFIRIKELFTCKLRFAIFIVSILIPCGITRICVLPKVIRRVCNN